MKLSYLLLTLMLIASAAALQEVPVKQGESITLRNTIPYQGQLSQTTAVYAIPEVDFFQSFTDSSYPSNTISHTLRFDIPAGTYLMYIVLEANTEVVSRGQLLVHVLPRTMQTTQATQQADVTLTIAAQPQTAYAITIPAIHDVTPGTTIVMPVTIRGTGVYELRIPKLSFASYEMPVAVYVNGEKTVPVLLHIDENAEPGIYVIPVSAGSEQTSARIRIIRYTGESYWWLLIPLGILFLILGVLILIQRTKKQPKQPEEGELITYY